MSENKDYIAIRKSPQAILSMIEIGVLIGTLIYLFAFLRADVDTNKRSIEDQRQQIEAVRQRSADTYVRKDVFNEQYRQIIQRLDELKEKLEEQ